MRVVRALLVGTAFGAVLARVGFASWDEVHRMFVFADLRLLWTFTFAVALLAPALWGLRRAHRIPWPRRPTHRGTVLGGALFGAGWALCGACPSIAFVQLGAGQLGAAWTLAGVLIGDAAFGWLNARFLHWSTGSCTAD